MSSADLIRSAGLISSAAQLQPERPTVKTYEIVQSSGQVNSLNSLENTILNYDFSIPQGSVWKPKQSFFRYKIKVEKAAEETPIEEGRFNIWGQKEKDGEDEEKLELEFRQKLIFDKKENDKEYSVALAYNAGSGPFQQIGLQMNGVPIDITNNLTLVDTICKRMTSTKEDIQFYGDQLDQKWWDRHRAITKQFEFDQGKDKDEDAEPPVPEKFVKKLATPYIQESNVFSCEDGSYEFLYRPSYSYWMKESLPPAAYQLNIQTHERKRILNQMFTVLSNAIDVEEDLKFSIELKFYITVQEAPSTTGTVLLDLTVVDYQNKDIVSKDGSVAIDIKPSTKTILTGFQSVMNNTGRSSSHPISHLQVQQVVSNDLEILKPNNKMSIKEAYIEYNGTVQPVNRFSIYDNKTSSDLYREIYFHNAVQSGNVLLQKSFESYHDFMYMGPYVLYNVENDRCNQRVNSYYQIDYDENGISPIKHIALIFSSAVVEIQYDSRGTVQSVRPKLN